VVYIASLKPESGDPSAGLDLALSLARELRDRGVRCDIDSREAKLKAMLRRADASKARLCVIIGDEEIAKNEFTVKDLANKAQEKLPRADAVQWIASRLATPASAPAEEPQ
jgi:histidyl-tRNA synthetase